MENKFRIRELNGKFFIEKEYDIRKFKKTGSWWSSPKEEFVETGEKGWATLNKKGWENEPYAYNTKDKAMKRAKIFQEWAKKGTVYHEVE